MSRTNQWLMELEERQQAEAAERYFYAPGTTLFYRTTHEIAEETLKTGFVDRVVSPSPVRILGVYLLDDGDAPGPGEAILKVKLPMCRADLEPFRLYSRFPGYCMPAELLNRDAVVSWYGSDDRNA